MMVVLDLMELDVTTTSLSGVKIINGTLNEAHTAFPALIRRLIECARIERYGTSWDRGGSKDDDTQKGELHSAE